MIDGNHVKPCLLTIGHSNHGMPVFVGLLVRHGVTAVADIRSHPYSRFHSQFNRETLAIALQQSGIQYVFLGRELGARRVEPESYQQNRACYDLIARLPAFREGLDRLRRGIAAHRIALLCAEKDPITCHRAVLVCRWLRSDPIDIQHILEDGSIETTEQLEGRLLDAVGLPSSHLFSTRAELIEQAYELQGELIAYNEPEVSLASGGSE